MVRSITVGDTLHRMLTWLDMHYRWLMLAMMAVELLLLAVLVVIEVVK